MNDVIKAGHDKETKLQKKIHTQEQKLRQHEHDLRSKEDQVLALKVEIADLKFQLDEFSNTKHEDSKEHVDEHREEATNKSSNQRPEFSFGGQEHFECKPGFSYNDQEELADKEAKIALLTQQVQKLEKTNGSVAQILEHSKMQSGTSKNLKEQLKQTVYCYVIRSASTVLVG